MSFIKKIYRAIIVHKYDLFINDYFSTIIFSSKFSVDVFKTKNYTMHNEYITNCALKDSTEKRLSFKSTYLPL